MGIYAGFCAVVQFLKTAENSYFWNFFNSSVTDSWISATSAEWDPFNFIFNLENIK